MGCDRFREGDDWSNFGSPNTTRVIEEENAKFLEIPMEKGANGEGSRETNGVSCSSGQTEKGTH